MVLLCESSAVTVSRFLYNSISWVKSNSHYVECLLKDGIVMITVFQRECTLHASAKQQSCDMYNNTDWLLWKQRWKHLNANNDGIQPVLTFSSLIFSVFVKSNSRRLVQASLWLSEFTVIKYARASVHTLKRCHSSNRPEKNTQEAFLTCTVCPLIVYFVFT